jgi:hypothetical protein
VLRPGADLTAALLADVGIGIFRSAPRQHHVAFIYEAEGRGILLSHLPTHRAFRGADPWDPKYFWTTLAGLEATNKQVFAAWLTALANKPIQVAYGFSDAGCRFDRDEAGEVVFVNVTLGKGLTCATFLIVALESFGYRLLVRDTWPARAEDKEWQTQILEQLRQCGLMNDAELDLLSNDVGSVRFRPIEVAASAHRANWPVNFNDASALAEQILAQIAELRFAPKQAPPAAKVAAGVALTTDAPAKTPARKAKKAKTRKR